MPNRLVKLGTTTYVPAIQSVPAREPYCVVRYATREKRQSIDAVRVASSAPVQAGATPAPVYALSSHEMAIYLSTITPEYGAGLGYITTIQRGGSQAGDGPPAQVKPAPIIYETYAVGVECFPYVPGVQGQAAYNVVDNKVGWNAGARSIVAKSGDCYAEFTLPLAPIGIVCGFANADSSTLPGDVTHGIYAHGGTIEIMERGQVIATTPVEPNTVPLIRIVRTNSIVMYYVGDWVMRSPTQSGGVVFLDAALYSAGDFVDSPVLAALSEMPEDVAQIGSGAFVTASPAFIGGIDYAQGAFETAAPVMSGTAIRYSVGAFVTAGPAFIGGIDYAQGGVATRPMRFTGDGGYPEITVSVGGIVCAPLMMSGASIVGAVGTGGIMLGNADFLGADRPYATGHIEVRNGPRMYGDDGPEAGTYGTIERLYLADYLIPSPTMYAVIEENLQLGTTMTIMMLHADGFVDGLELGDTLSPQYVILNAIHDALRIGNSLTTARNAALQYAVNAIGGALSVYENFDFTSFMVTPYGCYAAKADGVYRLGYTADDGDMIQASVDFGSDSFATNRHKYFGHVYVGIATDGDVYLRLIDDDGESYIYRVEGSAPTMRAEPAKGASAKYWRVQLDIVDATEVDLDSIQFDVALSTRRIIRGH